MGWYAVKQNNQPTNLYTRVMNDSLWPIFHLKTKGRSLHGIYFWNVEAYPIS